MALIMTLSSVSGWAQTQTVSGVVTDAKTNEPLIGAAVMVKGTTNGMATELDGKYTLKVKEGDVLVCQLFGYETKEVTFKGNVKIDFALNVDAEMLDATVVVGYGTLKKSQLVGSVENLAGDVIEDRPNANVAKSLQGQVAGLNIIQTDGKASHTGNIYIRGNATSYRSRKNFNSSASGQAHSLGTGGAALVLIDGVEGDLTTVNPADIENVAVLKDASSASIYGAKAAYGVILVTTKNASDEKFSISYNGSIALNTRTVKWEDHIVSDGLEWTESFYQQYDGNARTPGVGATLPTTANTFAIGSDYLERLRARRAEGNMEVYDMYNGAYAYYGNTNWVDMFYKDYNYSTTHDISVKGSSKRIQYSLSGRFFTQDGIYSVGDEMYNTFNIRSKVKVMVTDWMSIDNNTSLFRSNQNQPMFTTSSTLSHQLEHHGQPIFVPLNQDGTYTLAGNKTAYASFAEGNTGQDDRNLTVVSSTGLNIDIVKDVLTFRGDFSYKAIRRERERYRAPLTFWLSPTAYTEYVPQTSSYKSRWNYDTNYITANAFLTWTPKFGDNHKLNVVAGWNLEQYQYKRFYLQRKGMLFPDKWDSYELYDGTDMTVEQHKEDYGTVGFFGRANYTLLGRYILEAALRYDGSSKFPSSSRWGLFPSFSAGWRISEEPWMEGTENWLSNLKLRANYGSLGNGTVSPYTFLETMGIGKTGIVIDGNKQNYTTVPTPIPSTLTWETVTTYDVGLDADFLRNRLSFSGDYYIKNTTDLITVGPELPDLYGASAPQGNYAELQTKGWELTLSWRDSFKLGADDFTYGIKGSVWDTRTWVTEYLTTNNLCLGYYSGKELGEIWGFKTDGYFLSNEEANNWATDTYHKNGNNFRAYAGDLKFIDIDGDGDIGYGKQTIEDHGDLAVIGNQTPRYQFGLNLDFKWKGIGLSVFFQGIGKRDWYPSCETAFFYGQYNRPYSFLMKNQTGNNYAHINYENEDGTPNADWVVTNAADKPYWTRRVGYSGNRNLGPLTVENDYYLQNAAYVRLKNLTIDYTLPKKAVEKIHMQGVRFYLAMENLFTWSPIYKYTQMFDPEVITTGDSDFDTTGASSFGLSGVGDGSSYPMLKSFTFGVNLTF